MFCLIAAISRILAVAQAKTNTRSEPDSDLALHEDMQHLIISTHMVLQLLSVRTETEQTHHSLD